jgi:Leucine-rich repeat (LRR) protein
LGFKVNAARRQREAVEAILKAGGEVVYDYQMVPEGQPREFLVDATATASEPTWLVRWLGLDYFHDVVGVVLGPEHSIPRAEFVRLANLPNLKRLQLAGTKIALSDGSTRSVDSADIALLGKFAHLRDLMIQHANIDGTSVANLAPNLKSLALAITHVDDAGALQIGNLNDLEFLRLAGTLITDAGMKELHQLSKLSYLDIRDTAVSGAGLREIASLSSLKAIGLGGAHITDAGLKMIASLTNLSDIDLSNTTITDESIDRIALFANLTRVNLEYTQVTPEGIQRLQQMRPKLKILTMPGQFRKVVNSKAGSDE